MANRPPPAAEAFPTAGAPEWDPLEQAYFLVDSDGIRYYGATASECFRQYVEALHHLARSARDSGFDIAELRQFRRLEEEVPMQPDLTRRIALSRARQIANAATQGAEPAAAPYGVAPGAVLDYVELGLFLAVTRITRAGLYALGVQQEQPWASLKDVRMPANLVAFRLKRRGLRVVSDRRR